MVSAQPGHMPRPPRHNPAVEMTHQSRPLGTRSKSSHGVWVSNAASDLRAEGQDQPNKPLRYNRPHRGGYCMGGQDPPARPDLSKPEVLESPFRKPKPRAKVIGWSRSSWLVTFQSARPVPTKPAGHDRNGKAHQTQDNLGRVIGLGTSPQPARAEASSPTASRSRCLGSRSVPFGINPPVGTTTERGLSARLLSNNKTRPIHLDMNRARTTTFAGGPYNG